MYDFTNRPTPAFYRLLLFLFTYQLISSQGFAQTNKTSEWQGGISLSSGLSYTGFNLYLMPEVSYGKHNLAIGPKYVVSDSYVPYKNVWGYNISYRYDVIAYKHWRSGISADFQSSFYKPNNPYNLEIGNKHNKIHEMFVVLSLFYHFGFENRYYAGLDIGSGFFSESYHDLVADKVNRNFGRTNMVTFTIGYKIFKK